MRGWEFKMEEGYLEKSNRLFAEAEARWRAENPDLVAECDRTNRRAGMELYVLEFVLYENLERVVWA